MRLPFDYGIIGGVASYGWNSVEEWLLADNISREAKAKAILKRARSLPMPTDFINPHLKRVLNSVIAKQQTIRGNSTAAIATLLNVTEDNHEMRGACYAIAEALTKEGRMKILFRWTQSLWNHSNKAYAFCGAADGLLKYSEHMKK